MGNNLLPTRSDKNSKIMFGGNMIPALSLDLLNKDRKSHIDTAAIGAIPENEGMRNCPQSRCGRVLSRTYVSEVE